MTHTVPVMEVELAALSEAESVARTVAALREGRGGWICPVNLDVLRQVVEDEGGGLRDLIGGADLRLADGMPLLWAAQLQRTPLPERVAGSSLVVSLSRELGGSGRTIYLLGGKEGVAAAAARRLQDLDPGLAVAGTCCPPFGFERSAAEQRRVIEEVRSAGPDLVFVGLGFPKQERLIAELRKELPRAWFVSCGGTFSMLAGEVPRAHPLVQRLGLEWIHRLILEPKRLARRYLVQGLPFAAKLAVSSARRRRRRDDRSDAPSVLQPLDHTPRNS